MHMHLSLHDRHLLRWIVALIAAIVVLAMTCRSAGAASRPNFLVIMADDLGARELGCYGNTRHRTPNLDALAATGMRFETCYATPICTSTRIMIMTGRYAAHTGWWNFLGRPGSPTPDSPAYNFGEAELTFADHLRQAGYMTGVAGKWQLPGKLPTFVHDCGFDEYRIWAYGDNLPEGVVHIGEFETLGTRKTSRFWHPCLMQNGEYLPTRSEDYGPDLFTDFAIDFMKRHQDEPFVFYYPMVHTHSPWDQTPDLDHPGQKTPTGLKANVESMDHQMGRLVRALDDLKLRDKTIVLFTGDNGTQGNGKGVPVELGARVPLIVSCPGAVQQGGVSTAVSDLTDVTPTLLDFAGHTQTDGPPIDGHSLRPVLSGEQLRHREWAFTYLNKYRVLRDERWLLEGDGRFFDCGTSRDGTGYRDVTDSSDPDVTAARGRFESILASFPVPEDMPASEQIDRALDRWRQGARATDFTGKTPR